MKRFQEKVDVFNLFQSFSRHFHFIFIVSNSVWCLHPTDLASRGESRSGHGRVVRGGQLLESVAVSQVCLSLSHKHE